MAFSKLLTWCRKEFGQRATLESCNYTAFGAQIMTGVQAGPSNERAGKTAELSHNSLVKK